MPWKYEINLNHVGGPVDSAELLALGRTGVIQPFTLVWNTEESPVVHRSFSEVAKLLAPPEQEKGGKAAATPFIPAAQLAARWKHGTPPKEAFTPPLLHKWHLPD